MRYSDVLSIVITINVMEETDLELVDDWRGFVHTFEYPPTLQSTHLIHDWCSPSSFVFIHLKLNEQKLDFDRASILYNIIFYLIEY